MTPRWNGSIRTNVDHLEFFKPLYSTTALCTLCGLYFRNPSRDSSLDTTPLFQGFPCPWNQSPPVVSSFCLWNPNCCLSLWVFNGKHSVTWGYGRGKEWMSQTILLFTFIFKDKMERKLFHFPGGRRMNYTTFFFKTNDKGQQRYSISFINICSFHTRCAIAPPNRRLKGPR